MSLSEHSRKHVSDFFEAIEPLKGAYRDDTFGYLAIMTADGPVLVQGSLFLNVTPPTRLGSFRSSHVLAGSFRLTDLKLSRADFISQLFKGSIETPDVNLIFPPSSSGFHGTKYEPFHPLGVQSQRRINLLTVFGTELLSQIDLTPLDWELRAAPTPFDGVQDLLTEFGLGPLRPGVNSVEIAAFPVAAIDVNSTIDGEVARIFIHTANGLLPEKFSFGYRLMEQGRVTKRAQVTGSAFKWRVGGDVQIGSIEFQVPRAALLYCTAIYDGVAQQFYWVYDPTTFQSVRRAAYEAFDPNLSTLNDIFAKSLNRAESRNFESAVSWLFWMLGFAPAQIGGTSRTSDAADLVVCTPSGHFAVIECTTGLLKAENKLALLHDRTQAVRRNLAISNLGHARVLPVIVSSKTLDEVRPDLDQAEKLGIYVIAREGLTALVARTLIPPNADQLYEQAEAVISGTQNRATSASLH